MIYARRRQPTPPPPVCPKCKLRPCTCHTTPVLETEDDYERVREQLDAAMLSTPAVAHVARTAPLSRKYRASRLRSAR